MLIRSQIVMPSLVITLNPQLYKATITLWSIWVVWAELSVNSYMYVCVILTVQLPSPSKCSQLWDLYKLASLEFSLSSLSRGRAGIFGSFSAAIFHDIQPDRSVLRGPCKGRWAPQKQSVMRPVKWEHNLWKQTQTRTTVGGQRQLKTRVAKQTHAHVLPSLGVIDCLQTNCEELAHVNFPYYGLVCLQH